MVYLESKNIVHRDLAARNLLVTRVENKFLVKISDFGMSRVYFDEYKAAKAQIPWRWAAPETFKQGRFSSKSDVWSFGVTSWEILEYGARPYSWIVDNDKIAEAVLSGTRLPKPEKCPQHLYSLLVRCWEASADKRPSFSDILSELVSIKKTMELEIPLEPRDIKKDQESQPSNEYKQLSLGNNASPTVVPPTDASWFKFSIRVEELGHQQARTVVLFAYLNDLYLHILFLNIGDASWAELFIITATFCVLWMVGTLCCRAKWLGWSVWVCYWCAKTKWSCNWGTDFCLALRVT